MVGSDHRPIITTIENKIPRGRKQFRFDKRWIGRDGLVESISHGCEVTMGKFEQNFVDKISNCRREISKWRK